MTRASTLGQGPIIPVAVAPHRDRTVQQTVEAGLATRLVNPLRHQWEGSGIPEPQLYAELAAAAAIGIVLTRSAGTFPQLSAADPEHLAQLARRLLSGLAADPDAAESN